MTDPPSPRATAGEPFSPKATAGEPHYSPLLRTGLILTGSGTSGAYHAGVLRALHEAGVKIDIVGAHGIGTIGALFAAVDGAQRLWDEKGFWRLPPVRNLYRWHPMLLVAFGALALSLAIVVMPIAVMALGLVVYPLDFVAKMLGRAGADDWVSAYVRMAHAAFAPEALPTWLPRIVVLVLGAAALAALVIGWINRGARRQRGPFWWRMAPVLLSSSGAVAHCWRVMWDLLRGAAQLKQPTPAELSRRYLELAGENLGQPGFTEIVVAVHDLDVHRDLVFALVAESRRRELYRRPTVAAIEERQAEVFDLSGVAREYLPSVVAGALTLPVATEAAFVTFAPDAYWRGETHRLTDRPGIVARVVDELKSLGVEQILVVSAAPESHRPHALTPAHIDGRSRLGEYLQSSEAAAVRDATYLGAGPSVRVFTISPEHNQMGPFDFAGAFDDRSDRKYGLEELMARGYEDAYRQFIEPVVGASGERLRVRS